MSTTEFNEINNYSFRRRHDSGELDVFEAARYFSGVHENLDDYNMINVFPHKSIIEEIQRPERMRLDSMMRNPIPPQNHAMHQKEIKKNKQPSSPGGRLATFLNLLFNHTSSKKFKSKSIGTIKDLEEATQLHGGRRIGRSSKIYSRNPKDTTSAADAVDSKSMYSCSSSGFRTPPLPFSNVPTKPDEEFVRFFYPKNGGNMKPKSLHDAFYFDKISTDYFALSIEDKLRIFNIKNSAVNWIDDECPSEEKGFRKFSDADDGADTDSSSDLFDLPNHDLDVHGNGLPVYETTYMNIIRRGALV
ncbi:protein BIG GRAIN 1-like E [Primulina eburnea]|uniref:protein BIG GRAIN 1-like E n=1 Tax=Primulina eburnea TaxID=1245227 RepID=UPI003C6C41E7